MKKENLERGQTIQQELWTINRNIVGWRDKEVNPTAADVSYYGTGISPKATEEIREIAIKSLMNKRRSLQREFNKL